MGSAKRSPDEIRRSIEAHRAELAVSVERLRDEVQEVTDWRKQLVRRHREAIMAAAGAGFVLGGGVGGFFGLFKR